MPSITNEINFGLKRFAVAARACAVVFLGFCALVSTPAHATPPTYYVTCDGCSEAQAETKALYQLHTTTGNPVGTTGSTTGATTGGITQGGGSGSTQYTVYIYDFTLSILRYYSVSSTGNVIALTPSADIAEQYQATQQFVNSVRGATGATPQATLAVIPVPEPNPANATSAYDLPGNSSAVNYLGQYAYSKAIAGPLGALSGLIREIPIAMSGFNEVQITYAEVVFPDGSTAIIQIQLLQNATDVLSPIAVYAIAPIPSALMDSNGNNIPVTPDQLPGMQMNFPTKPPAPASYTGGGGGNGNSNYDSLSGKLNSWGIPIINGSLPTGGGIHCRTYSSPDGTIHVECTKSG